MQGLTARNHLTDVRDAVWNLFDMLPQPKQVVVARLYSGLRRAQGEMEKLLEDVPANVVIIPGEDRWLSLYSIT